MSEPNELSRAIEAQFQRLNDLIDQAEQTIDLSEEVDERYEVVARGQVEALKELAPRLARVFDKLDLLESSVALHSEEKAWWGGTRTKRRSVPTKYLLIESSATSLRGDRFGVSGVTVTAEGEFRVVGLEDPSRSKIRDRQTTVLPDRDSPVRLLNPASVSEPLTFECLDRRGFTPNQVIHAAENALRMVLERAEERNDETRLPSAR